MEEVKILLALRRWSQADLARRMRVSEATVSRWVAGKTVPNQPTLDMIKIHLRDARTRLGV